MFLDSNANLTPIDAYHNVDYGINLGSPQSLESSTFSATEETTTNDTEPSSPTLTYLIAGLEEHDEKPTKRTDNAQRNVLVFLLTSTYNRLYIFPAQREGLNAETCGSDDALVGYIRERNTVEFVNA